MHFLRQVQRPLNLHAESGNVLIMALLAIAAISAMYVGISNTFGDNAKILASTSLGPDRDMLRAMLLNAVDCNASMTATTCPSASGTFPTLVRRLPGGTYATIIAGGAGSTTTPTKIGRWSVRAECAASNLGFVIRAARMAVTGKLNSTSDADFLTDPVYGTRTKWSDASSIVLDSTAALCMPHTEASPGATPVLATTCSGTNSGGWCNQAYWTQITFAKPFTKIPRVLVSMAQPLTQANDCTQLSTDRGYTDASNITETGFKLWCSSSPRDASCLGNSYAAQWLMSTCSWVAFEQ